MKRQPFLLPSDLDAVPPLELVDLGYQSKEFYARHYDILGAIARRLQPEPSETLHGHFAELHTTSRLTVEVRGFDSVQADLWDLGLTRQTHTLRRERLARLLASRPDLVKHFDDRVTLRQVPWFTQGDLNEAPQ